MPFADNSFDVIFLNMVLQWVPRKCLVRTVAEIERTLCDGGFVFVQEFEPDFPKFSPSHHNPDIFIFKQNYTSIFTAYQWMKLLSKENLPNTKDDNYQKSISLIRKTGVDQAYYLKTW